MILCGEKYLGLLTSNSDYRSRKTWKAVDPLAAGSPCIYIDSFRLAKEDEKLHTSARSRFQGTSVQAMGG